MTDVCVPDTDHDVFIEEARSRRLERVENEHEMPEIIKVPFDDEIICEYPLIPTRSFISFVLIPYISDRAPGIPGPPAYHRFYWYLL